MKAKIFNQRIIYSYYARINNFGDSFNRDLVNYFDAELIYVVPEKSQTVFTGSILGNFKREYSGYILGAGFISERYVRNSNQWKIRIIRGPLSGKRCDAPSEVLYADPGILASKIYPCQEKKKFKLGIVPHKRDIDFIKHLSCVAETKIIDPRDHPFKVAKQIKQCRFIASSSLHGLIFADSFRIPNIHLRLGDRPVGGIFKFCDYYLGMDVDPEHLDYRPDLSVEEIIGRCKLRYTENYLVEKQQEIERIYNSVFSEISQK
nr:polysaccharide pyruvyl transferase family protein [Salinimicrobium sediminis]